MMPSEILRERYQNIAKASMSFLKEQGFKKKGSGYFLNKGELILEISTMVPRAWLNCDKTYEFSIGFALWTTEPHLLAIQRFMREKGKLANAYLIGVSIHPDNYTRGSVRLEFDDPHGFDEDFILGVKNKIAHLVLPWFDSINTLDDVIQIAEAEIQIERSQRKFFRHTNIHYALVCFYAAKGWKDKFLQMCEQYIEKSQITSRDLAEEKSQKLIKYFDEIHKS